jgi:hypothetical protein
MSDLIKLNIPEMTIIKDGEPKEWYIDYADEAFINAWHKLTSGSEKRKKDDVALELVEIAKKNYPDYKYHRYEIHKDPQIKVRVFFYS